MAGSGSLGPSPGPATSMGNGHTTNNNNNSVGVGAAVSATNGSGHVPHHGHPAVSREESPQKSSHHPGHQGQHSPAVSTGQPPGDSKTWKIVLPHNATAETTSGWLAYNR